jgi:hypothetical protein
MLREVVSLQNLCSGDSNPLHATTQDYLMNMLSQQARERLNLKDV